MNLWKSLCNEFAVDKLCKYVQISACNIPVRVTFLCVQHSCAQISACKLVLEIARKYSNQTYMTSAQKFQTYFGFSFN